MKKYISIVLVILLSTTIIVSCKKDSTSKDYTPSIKDKTWWGQFFYTGKPSEYYAIHFTGDGSLTWSEYSGDYQGKWILDGNQLTISFDGTGNKFKATISDDNKMLNIINTQTNGYSVISGELVANLNTPLENTIWIGSVATSANTNTMKLSFMAGLKVELKFGSLTNPLYPYTISMLSGVIRMSSFFGIITSANEMRGSVDNAGYLWQAMKQ